MVDSNTRQAKRTPVTLKVKFKSETLDQFIERYAVDVSPGGIFIRTKEPQPVGTQMKFEFQLRDGAPLIAGEGTVVWIRELNPSRPAVAPGMGVRFDKLSDGSRAVLDQILDQKSRQSSTSRISPSKPPAFNDSPTRVAQVPLGDDMMDREQPTPLPSPMPFHSDADEFPDEAFEEATKVRSVEELVAQTAMGGLAGLGSSPSLGDLPFPPAPSSPPRQGSSPRIGPAFSGRASSPAVGAPPAAAPPPAAERRSANVISGLASGVIGEMPPPAVEEDQSLRTLIDAVQPPPLSGAGRTLIDAAPPPPSVLAQAALTSLAPSPMSSGTGSNAAITTPPASREDSRPRALESITSAITPSVSVASHPSSMPPPVAAAVGRPEPARAREPSRPPATAAPLPNTPMVARPAQGQSKMTLLIVALVCVLAAAVALVWLLVIKQPDKPTPAATQPTTENGSGSAGSAAITAPQPDTGSTGSAGAGSAGSTAGADSGSGAAPAGELADTTIEAAYRDASIEVQGTDQRGKAPLVAKLAKGKSYTVKITAPGYVASDLTVIGGNDNKIAVKLDAKPYVIQVNSTPGSASVYVDGNPFKRVTPASIDLAKAQGGKKLRVMVRKVGFQPFFVTVKPEDFTEEPDRMVFEVNASLTAATRPTPGGGDTGGGDTGGGDTGSGGGDTPAPEQKPAETKPEQKPAETKPAEPGGEPAPDWTKQQ